MTSGAAPSASAFACSISSVSFGSHAVLKAQELSFRAGVSSLVGRNGAGKTTFFRCLMGLLPGCDSELTLPDGTRISASDRSGFMAKVGYLPQDVPHPRSMSALDFVRHAAWLKGLGKADADRLSRDALDRVKLGEQLRTRMSDLSGGMRRRAGLAAAMVHAPTLLVLDEPTSGLDPLERARFHAMVEQLASDHIVLVSTHLLEDVLGVGGTVSVLSGGLIQDVGAVADLSERGPLADVLLPFLDLGDA